MVAEMRHWLERWQLLTPTSWIVIGLGSAWTLVFVGSVFGSVTMSSTDFLLLSLVPLALMFVLMLTRNHWPLFAAATGWMAIVSTAFYAEGFVVVTLVVAIAIPLLALSGLLARRYPATFLVLTLAATGFFGTAEAFLGLSVAPAADLLLAGLWLGTLWSYLVDSERRRMAWFTGLALTVIYVLLSFFEVFSSSAGLFIAAQDFRGSIWYMMSFLLLTVAPLPRAAIRRAAMGFVLVAVAVGGYATFRWITGQSGHELSNAFAQTTNNVIGDRVRLIGSFVGGKELAAWTSTAIPFCLACGLLFSGRRRAIALSACALCAVAMFGSDVRVALVAVVPAVAAVFALYQMSRAFPGTHLGTTLSALFAALVIGVGAFALTLGGNSDTAQRYQVLVTNPTQDPSYQARLYKWGNALVDIKDHPLGQGLGTAGRTQMRYGHYVNISNVDVDNSYLKVALEQGAGVMAFFIVGLVLLAWGLARRAVRSTEPLDAGLAIGAVGVLIAFAVLMFAGTYIEGLPALGAWLLVGVGSAGVTRRREPSTGQSVDAAAADGDLHGLRPGDPGPPGLVPSDPPAVAVPAGAVASAPPPATSLAPDDAEAALVTARALTIDAVAREVWSALNVAGVEGVLLKGASLADWLYDDGTVRSYSDVDMLVAPDQVAAAERVLGELGFEAGESLAPAETPHARPWQRARDAAVLDLHWTLPGACVAPPEVWQAVRAHAIFASVGGGEVRILDEPARALLVALHAAQHEQGKPLEDLARALERASVATWREAGALADRLHAAYGFSRGLRMLPTGSMLADRLGLPTDELLDVVAANPGDSLVMGIERLRNAPGLSRKLGLLGHELAPDPEFLRWRFPLARRGRIGLALTYAGRPGWLAWRAVPSARAWRNARSALPPDRRLPPGAPEEPGARGDDQASR